MRSTAGQWSRASLRLLVRVVLPAIAVLMAVPASADEAVGSGTIPQGIWALNEARSHSLNPGRQILWVVKDDRRSFVWVSIVIHEGKIQILSYNGVYGGQQTKVDGAPIVAATISTGPHTLRNSGVIQGRGEFFENCRVYRGRKRLRCEGQVRIAGQAVAYVDDFDWFSESPPAVRP